MVNIESFINIFDAFKVMKLNIKKPFSKRQMEYWKELNELTTQEYGAKLVDYVENGLQEGKPINYLASEIGTNYLKLYKLAKNLGIQVKNRYNPKEIKKELKHIEDIMDLGIRDISCLSYREFIDWQAIENRVKQEYKAPSLSAYLIYEHQFNNQSLSDLRLELNVTINSLKRAMVKLGIPLIDYRRRKEDYNRKKDYNPQRNHLMKKYWYDGLTLRQIAKEEGVSAQAVLDRMKALDIPRRTHSKTLTEKLSICLIN